MQKITHIIFNMLIFISILIPISKALGDNVNCTISSPAIAFGTINIGTTNSTTVNISVTCTCNQVTIVNYTITLSTGASNSYTKRNMTSGSNIINYQVYTNSGATQIFGNGTANTVTITDGYLIALGSVTKNYTIYGRIPAQTAQGGTYNDSLTATLTYIH